MCTNLKQINPHQWKHIMHRQLSPIGEVGIYKNAIHTLSESVLTHTRVTEPMGTHQASPVERWASIRMQYIWVCVLTHTCVLTHVCSSLASATTKGSSNITINGK